MIRHTAIVIVALLAALGQSHTVAGISPTLVSVRGLTVHWPFAATQTVAPGSLIRIGVRCPHSCRAHTSARLRLLLAPAHGRARVIAHKRLRSGVFAVRLSHTHALRYLLTLDIGGVHVRSILTTGTQRDSPAGPPVESPAGGEPLPEVPCVSGKAKAGTASGTIALDRSRAAPGEQITVSVQNTGALCLTGSAAYTWDELVGGSWVHVPVLEAFPEYAVLIAPGRTWTSTARINPEMTPGHYRLTKTFGYTSVSQSSPGELVLTAELDVQAP